MGRRKNVGLLGLLFSFFSVWGKETYKSGYRRMHGRNPRR